MTIEETIDLLTAAAAFDRRTVGKADAVAWHTVVGDLAFVDCLVAVRGHYTDTTDWLMPAHVRQRVRAMRRDRIDRAIPAAPPAEVADAPGRYKAALEAGIRRIADGRSVHRAIGGPVRNAEPPAEFTEARAEMGAALERDGSLSPQEIARRVPAAFQARPLAAITLL